MTDIWRDEVPDALQEGTICLFPGIKQREGLREDEAVTTFLDCLPYLGDCKVLIFCELNRTQEEIFAYVERQEGEERNGIHIREVTITPDPVVDKNEFFRNYQDPLPVWIPAGARPPENSFWWHWSELEIMFPGQEAKTINLLHLGIGGQAVWLYFLNPHHLEVSRIIIDPREATL